MLPICNILENGVKKSENYPILYLETIQKRIFAIVLEHRMTMGCNCWNLQPGRGVKQYMVEIYIGLKT